MNWEVSSMPFKRSFFNPTLFQKNLSRSWPMWGGVTIVGSLFPLYLLLSMMNQDVVMESADFATFLYEASVFFLPAFTCGYALLVAMFVWSYLHNTRAVGMMHSLAVDRTNLFITNSLSGLAMLLIPYVVVGGLLCVIAACCGALHGGAVLTAVAAVILDNLLFFGMGTLCAAVTGNVFAVAVYYLVLNFAVPVLDLLINNLAQEFIFGLTSEMSRFSVLLSPVVSLYDNVDVNFRINGERLEIPEVEGFHFVVIYGIVGILMLALSYLFYRNRRSESAGDVVAFGWLRPAFRICISVASALTLGRVLYELFWASLFQQGDYASIVPMGICMAVTAVIGYYAATMLLEKTLRVFKGSLKGVAVVCAVTVVLCAAVAMDLFGIERYVPDTEEIETVELSGNVDVICHADTMPALTEEILALHSSIVEDADYIKSFDTWDYHSSVSWAYHYITYILKDGSRVERQYQLPVTQERLQNSETYDGKIMTIIKNPEALLASVTMPESAEIASLYVEFYDVAANNWEYYNVDSEDCGRIYEALLADAREGNFDLECKLSWDMAADAPDSVVAQEYDYPPNLNIEYRVRTDVATLNGSIYRSIQPTMKHTIKALLDCGVITGETIAGWNEAE